MLSPRCGSDTGTLKKVRDLGVVIDGELNMDAHARNVVRSCFYQLRQLRTIRRSLPMDA